jgi:signal transduction histidine kinase
MLSSALLAITLVQLFGSYRLSRAVRRARECIAEIEAGNFASRIRSPGSSDIDELAVGINRLAELLELVRAESVRSESARKRLLSDISHDIRTPLTSIIGYVGALRDDIADTGAERDEYVAILEAKSRALKDMVEDIFQLAKLDADEIPMNLERLDLASLVREVLVDFLPEFRAAGIDLVAEIPDAALFVFADRMSCERIVRNLVQNAICHGAGGAYVRVSVAERGATRNDPVVLSVADRGHGIASEDIPRVFTRLFRRESARTGAVGGSGGSGLGLAIVQSLARKNGADVSVTSGPVERSGAFSSHDSPVNETVFEVSFSRIQDDVRKC